MDTLSRLDFISGAHSNSVSCTVNSVREEIPGEMSLYMESINVYSFCLTLFFLDDKVPSAPHANSLWTLFISLSLTKEAN